MGKRKPKSFKNSSPSSRAAGISTVFGGKSKGADTSAVRGKRTTQKSRDDDAINNARLERTIERERAARRAAKKREAKKASGGD